MSALRKVLMHSPTDDQLEVLEKYPQIAIDYAIGQLEKRNEVKSFNYFLGVVKSFIAKKVPNAVETASQHRYHESADQAFKFKKVLYRSQARIKARNHGYEPDSYEYKLFVKMYTERKLEEDSDKSGE